MNELSIRLNTDGNSYLYEQIYEYIRDEIKEGKLLTGERLPSTRFLAEYLQVSRSTVELSYEQLLSEGYIESKPYKGYFVCKVDELYDFKAIPKIVQESKPGPTEYLYDFTPNGIELNGFPLSTWKKISRNVMTEAGNDMFELGDSKGDADLRETISRYLHASRGVNCQAEQVIIGAGNDYLFMLLEKIIGCNYTIGMEHYTYKRAYRIFNACGFKMASIEMDDSGISVIDLEEKKADIAYVMPAHQYPIGVVMPIGRRMELLRWASREENRYLIEDDYDSEFRYKGKPIPSLQASDQGDNVIYMGTFSKSIAPAIRISYMVLPEKLVLQYENKCTFLSCTVSRIDQGILNEFIRDGYYERHLNRMRKIYRAKHDYLLKLLEEFELTFKVSGENAGVHVLLKAQNGMSEAQLIESAKAHNVKVYGISDSSIRYDSDKIPEDEYSNPVVLLGYCGMNEKEIKEGIKQLKKAWL